MRHFRGALALCTGLFGAHFGAAQDANVLTHRYDNFRSGANLHEKTLRPSKIKTGQFGKLAFRIVDGNVYAQPLIVSKAKIGGGRPATNLAIVATEHNSVYAFDAEDIVREPGGRESQRAVWHTGPNVLGTSVPYTEMSEVIGVGGAPGCVDLTTEVGITSTPAIHLTKDVAPREGVIFVVAKSKVSFKNHAYKLFALNLSDGSKIGEITISGEVNGTGFGSVNQKIRFDAGIQLNRPGLLLLNGTLYIGFGGHCDRPRTLARSYHGWLFAYDVSNPKMLRRLAVFCTTPNGRSQGTGGQDDGTNIEGAGGIWMSGAGPAIDDDGNIYVSTGDGSNAGTTTSTDFGNSVLRLKLQHSDGGASFQVLDWYSPQNQRQLTEQDADLGSGGPIPIRGTNLLLAGGKEGRMYLINRNAMGKGATPSLDSFIATRPKDGPHYYNIHGAPVVWQREMQQAGRHMFVYVNGEEDALKQYKLIPDPTPGGPGWTFFSNTPRARFADLKPFAASCGNPCISAPYYPFPHGMFGNPSRKQVWMPGGFVTLSADGDQAGTGVIWVSMPYSDNANMKVVNGVLRAFDATDVSKQLWDSQNATSDDQLGQFAKFNPPVVANGKVYMGTFHAEEIRKSDEVHVQRQDAAADRPALVIYGLK